MFLHTTTLKLHADLIFFSGTDFVILPLEAAAVVTAAVEAGAKRDGEGEASLTRRSLVRLIKSNYAMVAMLMIILLSSAPSMLLLNHEHTVVLRFYQSNFKNVRSRAAVCD